MRHTKEQAPNQRITRWLERLEWQIEALLEDVVLDDLSTKDRLTLATRYIQQMQHFLRLSQQVEANTRSNEEQAVIESMKAWMRGEHTSEAFDLDQSSSPPFLMPDEPGEAGTAVPPHVCQPITTLDEAQEAGTAVPPHACQPMTTLAEPGEVGKAVPPHACQPMTSPQLSMFAHSRICRDGMGPMNLTNSITMQSRLARQSLRPSPGHIFHGP